MKPISISLSPNVERDDVILAFSLLFQPWKWKRGKQINRIEEKLKNYLGVKHVSSFNSGRSSLMAILTALELPDNSEVLLQAFTCNAASNPISWSGLKPVYVDCNKDTFNIDISDLKAKIGPNARVLMVQHTYGLPADMDEIMAIVKQYGLILIEDCAHSLGAKYGGQKIGTFGRASFFSFGRDKVISSVWGGAVATNDSGLAKKINDAQDKFGYPSYSWILQQLLHPVLMDYIILPLYNFLDLGKIFLVLSQWTGVLSKAVNWKEKRGKRPSYFPERLPNALAILAIKQFDKLDKFWNHRRDISEFYYNRLAGTKFKISEDLSPDALKKRGVTHSLLRFTVQHPMAHEILYQAWHKENIIIGDWYTSPVIPADTDLNSVGYKVGSCPNAEKLSNEVLNLPTHINVSQKDAERIVRFLLNFR